MRKTEDMYSFCPDTNGHKEVLVILVEDKAKYHLCQHGLKELKCMSFKNNQTFTRPLLFYLTSTTCHAIRTTTTSERVFVTKVYFRFTYRWIDYIGERGCVNEFQRTSHT